MLIFSVYTTAELNLHAPIDQIEEDYCIDGRTVHGKLHTLPPPHPPN